MDNDICLLLDQGTDQFNIARASDIPEILRAVITLVLFSNDKDLRVFNGEGVYSTLTKYNSGSIDDLRASLTLLSSVVTKKIKQEYPEARSVSIDATVTNESRLDIFVNVTTSDSAAKAVMYSKTI